MKILELTLLTEDEEYQVEAGLAERVATALAKLRPKMDTYNNLYVLRVELHTVDAVKADVEEGGDESQ